MSNFYTTTTIGTKVSGRCREVTVVERVQLRYTYELIGIRDKISYRWVKVVVSEGSTVVEPFCF